MRIVTTSDLHNRHNHLENTPGDLLLIAGDLTGTGNKSEIENSFKWLKRIAKLYTYGAVIIAGNHDKCFDPKFWDYDFEDTNGELPKVKPHWLSYELLKLTEDGTVIYLEDEEIIINGLKIWGSPITPWFHGEYWAFNKFRGPEIKKTWDKIPDDADILLIHGPSAGHGDMLYNGTNSGCDMLAKKIRQVKPKLMVFGHIHEAYGISYDEFTIYANSCLCNMHQEPKNKPHIFDYIDGVMEIIQ